MRTNPTHTLLKSIALVLLLSTLNSQLSTLAQGTAFTYQGRLNENGSPANGIYDLRFGLYDSLSNGNAIGGLVTNAATSVSNGLFVAVLDFGPAMFDGRDRWLEIGVRTNGSPDAFAPLSPRQPITPAPYAIFSSSSGSVSNGLIQNPLFIGTTGSTPLELFAGNQRALRLEPNTNGAPNVIAGSPANRVDPGVIAATISGGGAVDYFGGTYSNRISGSFDVIGGGLANVAGGAASVIGGGSLNINMAVLAVVAGGSGNDVFDNATYSAIGGGAANIIQTNAAKSVITGGYANLIEADATASSILGGEGNTNSAVQSVVAGGVNNWIQPFAGLSSIGGGWYNIIQSGADQSVIAGGNADVIEGGARESFIGGGFNNHIQTNAGISVIGGGAGNIIGADSPYSTIAGGGGNFVATNSPYATIGGGQANFANYHATIAGGQFNSISNADGAAILGGIANKVSVAGVRSVIGGGQANLISPYAWWGTIGGGQSNSVSPAVLYGTVAGGFHNASGGNNSFVGGGQNNTSGGVVSVVSGGQDNLSSASASVVSGGHGNTNRGYASVIAGGRTNYVASLSDNSVIGGGENNQIVGSQLLPVYDTIGGGQGNSTQTNAVYSTISGGIGNTAQTNAQYATIPGGASNSVAGSYSFAAGNRAGALHNGAFVWADSTDASFSSTAPNQFLIRANGGVGIGTNNPTAALEVVGAVKAAAFQGNGSGLTNLSGANLTPASVTTAGLSDGAVNSAKIADGSIVAADVNVASFATTFWKANGNAGTTPAANFLGTTDNQPLEIRVNNSRAFRLQPIANDPGHSNLVNVVGGSSVNFVVPFRVGATIAGGGGLYGGPPAATNSVVDDFGTVGGGNGNSSGFYATVAGGVANQASGEAATVGGGSQNSSTGIDSSIGGGTVNYASGRASTVGGGFGNGSSGAYATIPGGYFNQASASNSFAAGHLAHATNDGAFVWADSQNADFYSTTNNQFSIRAQNGLRLNTDTSLLFGSGAKLWPDQGGSIELGDSRRSGVIPYIDFHYGVGSDQDYNVRLINDADGQLSLYGGSLGFGAQTRQMLNLYSTAYGIGVQGYRMYFRTDGPGGFAWYAGGTHSDATDDPGPGGTELMKLESSGNLSVRGVVAQNVLLSSDRNVKSGFQSIDSKAILEKVAALPISHWHYTNDPATPHIGPMAQDFSAAFNVGSDDKHIATVDADGVALAAIQGLNQKVEALEEEVHRRDAENAELKLVLGVMQKRMAEIEKLIGKLTAD